GGVVGSWPSTAPPTATVATVGATGATPPVSTPVPTPPTAPPTAPITTPTLGPATPPPTAGPTTPPTPPPEQRLQAIREALQRGEFPTALSLLEVLQRDAPTTPGLTDTLYEAHLGYGNLLLSRDQIDESWGEYGRALEVRPNDPAALDGQK